MQILPSSHPPAGQGTPGLELAPFRGVRYSQDRVSGLAEVTSPPYDVIAGDNEDQLLAADPHNIVRIIRPRHPAGQPGTPWQDAADSLGDWLAGAVLVPDSQPALYVYEQLTPAQGGLPGLLQRGLIGAVRLVPREAGIVQPHEAVAPGPVTGRRLLMEATQANLEPIFLLYDGAAKASDGLADPDALAGPGADPGQPGAATRIVTEAAATRPPLAEARTADGIRHRLWAITGPAELAEIAADLAPRTALIADGHHRYAAYLQLQERRRQAGDGDGPWDFGLALLVDSAAYPPHVGAIHRVIPGLDAARAVGLAQSAFTVRELPGGTGDLATALRELDAAGRQGVAFLVAGHGRAALLTDPDPAQLAEAMAGRPAGLWERLPAAVLQDLLMARVWEMPDDEATVRVIHDPQTALRAAAAAPGTTAVLCSPMTAADVYEVAAMGRIVPRKSTSFGPKPRTGLVIRTFAQG
ncbi:MAG TPA: DUF1015 domain-containing protein [Streptosporangiaceae bacterium]|nr:DUF1015 domain-containing protein [Streptosporangiaceae bacterium]